MSIATGLFVDAQSFINNNGENIRFCFFDTTHASGNVYDDDVTLAKSGNDINVSGLVQPLNSNEAQLLQQGALLTDNLKVYVAGNTELSGTWKLGIGGSPPANEYSLSEKNVTYSPFVNGSIIYKKLFVTRLTTGSLALE